jgi:hypothetical protein
MNFILAILWLIGGVALFIYQHLTGDRRLHILNLDLSLGWIMLAFSLYNFARWFSLRSGRASRDAFQQSVAERHRAAYRRQRREEPPDPNFNFTDEPPPSHD